MKKDILVNGVVVGSHEATGDIEKDIAAVDAFLKEKGLKKDISTAEAMHGGANSFANVAKDIYEKGLKKSPFHGPSLSPFIVNATFSIELYLKAIHAQLGQMKKGHHLANLYKSLPNKAKQHFVESANSVRPFYKLENGVDIHVCLTALSKAFEQWRYFYEYNGISIELQSIRYTMHVSHEACCRVMESAKGT